MTTRIFQTDPNFEQYLYEGKISDLMQVYDFDWGCPILTGLIRTEDIRSEKELAI